ncbi:MAG: DUF2089 domain-containing protein [Clostridia bacterium]|nr:DUF2089 domain-containing protein [Clostridia bacterium]
MAQRGLLGRCPVCGEPLEVTELACRSCDTTIRGRFLLGRFAALTPEQWEFLEIFVRNRGNIREVERDMGLSYPAVRSRLDGLVEALGYPEKAREAQKPRGEPGLSREERLQVLEELSRGAITAREAIDRLRGR